MLLPSEAGSRRIDDAAQSTDIGVAGKVADDAAATGLEKHRQRDRQRVLLQFCDLSCSACEVPPTVASAFGAVSWPMAVIMSPE